ncbi:hypothetical protein SAMN05660199_01759 [Klenkia soli]|uniref:Uncharacterized protein n=1 Tax=Klenkia soli TaxID=1052260 RepID=A0A1H0ISP4_9ACTN|nr:hypothetical protein [Klenkia soli]SDO34372.1 hypothetical protein SAMN05660199_01759 [Klenkia soli]
MTTRRRAAAAGLAALLTSVLVALSSPAPAQAAPVGGTSAPACVNVNAQADDLLAQASALDAQIAAHNAQPVDTTNAAAVAAYNARADELNAQRDGLIAQANALDIQVAQCISLDTQIQDTIAGQPGDWSYEPSPEVINAFAGRLAPLNRAAVPLPTAPKPNGAWSVNGPMAPYYDPVRNAAPPRDVAALIGDEPLNGQPRPAVGDPDPAFPGLVIQGRNGKPNVSPDHIVPLSEIAATMPGFWQLNPRNMLLIINAPVNYQWLSWLANQSKQNRPVTTMSQADPAWVQDQLALREQVLTRLRQAIDLMLQQQQAAGG